MTRSTPSILASPAAAQTPPAGLPNDIFYHDFTAPLADNWAFDIGTSYPGGAANWGTGEIQTYDDAE